MRWKAKTTYVWEAGPCSTLPTAGENAVTESAVTIRCLTACSSRQQFLERSKHIKGSKERCLLGQNTTCEFSVANNPLYQASKRPATIL